MENNQSNNKSNRTEVIGKQKTLLGNESIDLVQFKNLKEKREIKEKVKKMFDGEMIRSIITPRDIDGNKRSNKLERQHQSGNRDTTANTMERADSFGKKTLNTLSTFPSTITIVYTKLLSKEGDWVYDPFMGHNSRGEDVLSTGRKYASYDIHSFPVEFTRKACERFPKENYELNLGSSEKSKYNDETFDFSITCPPYADVEQYNKIYGETKHEDLSSKDLEEFLVLYKKCLSDTYRVLKKGAFFVLVIGDVHRNGKFTSLSNLTDQICESIGFIKHDENIYNRKSNIGGDLNYKTFILTCRRFPTIHEYILIYQKPLNPSNKNISNTSAITKFINENPTSAPKQEQKPNITFTPPNPLDELSKIPEINEIERARLLRKLALQKPQPLINQTESITLSKDIFEEVMQLFQIKVKNCKFCNHQITKDNFGIIGKDFFVCNEIDCLFQAFDNLDENGGTQSTKNKE
jgi:DNA modification methylase